MTKQLDLFSTPLSQETFDYGKGEVKEEPREEIKPIPIYDKMMSFLETMNNEIQKQNDQLQAMIDELQEGWTDEEKLQVNDPKEYARQQELKRKQEKDMPQILASDVIESIRRCRVEGSVVFLPPISEGPLANYDKVRQALLNAGAKYKKNTFVFSSDAQPFIDRLTNGESVNIKKEFQYFPTPDDLADYLVELAGVNPTDSVLEPSAGQGAIIKAIHRAQPDVLVKCFELMAENCQILSKLNNVELIGNDFNAPETDLLAESFDKIIANPPFSKNQDIDHIRKMYSLLKPGGTLVSIASNHWKFSGNAKETGFRNWVYDKGRVIEIERGRFKESGTMIETCIIVIEK